MRRSILAALVLAAMSAPVLAGAQARLAVAGSEVTVTRLCEVYSRGDMYCRNVDQLLENEWRSVDPAALQASFRKVYEDRGLNQRHNGLMSCGSGTFAAAPQSRGPMPTTQDLTAGRNSCLRELEKAMGSRAAGRGRGRGGVFGGAPWNPGSGGGSTWTGTTCTSAGDPTRAAADGGGGNLSHLVEPLRTPEEFRDLAERQEALAEGYTDLAQDAYDAGDKDEAKRLADEASRLREEAAANRAAATEAEKPKGGSQQRTGAGGATCQDVDAAIRDQLAECDRNGWTSYECQKMKACSNPGVTDPIPNETGARAAGGAKENEGRPGMSCGAVTIFGDDDLGRAMQGYCDERARYGPDGGGVCASFVPDSRPRQTGTAVNEGSARRAACGMRAIPVDGCLVAPDAGSVFPSFRRNLQDELVNAYKKLGGPAVVIPVRNPAAPSGGPRPRPGSASQTKPTGRPTP